MKRLRLLPKQCKLISVVRLNQIAATGVSDMPRKPVSVTPKPVKVFN